MLSKSVAVAAALVVSVGVLTACGSSSDSPSPSSSSGAPVAPSPSPSDAMVGGDPATWSPVEITPEMNGSRVELVVGQRVVFRGFPEGMYEVDSSDANVAAPSIPGADVAGFSVLAPGVAEVTLFDVSSGSPEPVVTVSVEVAVDGLVGGDASTWTPVEVTPAMNGETVDVVVGQAGLFAGLPDRLVVVQSSDPSTVAVYQASDDSDVQTAAGFQAVAAGSATVTVVDAVDGSTVLEVTVNVSAS